MPVHPRPRRDRAQVTPLAAIVLVLAGLLLVPTAQLVRATLDRAEARTAADAAALAGAARGQLAARDLAEANGGELVAFTRDGDRVEVTVRVGGRTATASAVRRIERIAAAGDP